MTITDNPTKSKSSLPNSDPLKSSDDYRAWRESVADEFDRRRYFDEAERWSFCNSTPRHKISRTQDSLPPDTRTVWVCSESHEHEAVIFSITCDNRVCPDCARRHSARLIARYVGAIGDLMVKHPEYRLRKLTLTRKVKLGDKGFKEIAQDGFDLIQQAMREVVGPDWKEDGRGLLANWEVGPTGLKLHYHVIYFGGWVDQRRLSDVWKVLTGDSFVVWVSAVKHNDGDWQKAVTETLKYATKFYKEDRETGKRKYLSPSLTVDLFEALKGTRRIRSYGSLFRIEPPTEQVFECGQCNAPMKRIGVEYYTIWKNTGFNPWEWMKLVSSSLLQYKLANKSPPEGVKTDNQGQIHAPMLPGFASIPVKGNSHYDY